MCVVYNCHNHVNNKIDLGWQPQEKNNDKYILKRK